MALVSLVFFGPFHLQAWAGGLILLVAFVYPWWVRRPDLALKGRLRQWQAQRQAKVLDWKIIDNTVNRQRLQRDCERPETLGVCTGRDCLVYETCDFNIKRIIPSS